MLAVVEPISRSRLEDGAGVWERGALPLRDSDIERIGRAALTSFFWTPLGTCAAPMADLIASLQPEGGAGFGLPIDPLDGDQPSTEHIYAGACRHFGLGLRPAAAFGFLTCYSGGKARPPERPHLPSVFGLAVIAAHENRPELAIELGYWLIDQGFDHPRVSLLIGTCALNGGEIAEARRALTTVARRARGNPNYREDQHTAQRLLIGIQFGVTPNAPERE
ncbi:hypothetical protein [Aquibium microcysteis]|uniref:hypothetical protein n=1 Tax=Aquibium microcysteis TaxID=675281 RepID=UPI00165CF27C|nr:hypothetical protein [Aquibium microcysteis]